jgi:hypothetical protein
VAGEPLTVHGAHLNLNVSFLIDTPMRVRRERTSRH